jgi:hypothetical protein
VELAPVRKYDIQPTQFRVADFLSWQRDKSLILTPPFQRRAVWKPGAKSYFLDTIYRGLPVPLVFVREKIDLKTQRVLREIVDGQQRLRTLFSFIDESSLEDFDSRRDRFTVRPTHNELIKDKSFSELDEAEQNQILEYRFSVQLLPREVDDREVLQIFARMNSTGVRLNGQELRNAEFFGEFKTAMYDLAYEQLERWLSWRLFNEEQISRMLEVELVSDLFLNMIHGLSGKSQPALGRLYEELDARFPGKAEATRRFRQTIDAIDDVYGHRVAKTIFNRQMHFFSLFLYFYNNMYGLETEFKRRGARPLRRGLAKRIDEVDERYRTENLPAEVLEAASGAASDIGRRRTRLEFLIGICDGKSG